MENAYTGGWSAEAPAVVPSTATGRDGRLADGHQQPLVHRSPGTIRAGRPDYRPEFRRSRSGHGGAGFFMLRVRRRDRTDTQPYGCLPGLTDESGHRKKSARCVRASIDAELKPYGATTGPVIQRMPDRVSNASSELSPAPAGQDQARGASAGLGTVASDGGAMDCFSRQKPGGLPMPVRSTPPVTWETGCARSPANNTPVKLAAMNRGITRLWLWIRSAWRPIQPATSGSERCDYPRLHPTSSLTPGDACP